jgi:hypothetical protein
MNITSFVRGMAWHDIAKPLRLNSARHSRLGFLLLEATGWQEEALVALAHVGFDRTECIVARNLDEFFRRAGAPDQLPAILLLANSLDRLAASTYSMMSAIPGNAIGVHSFGQFVVARENIDAIFQNSLKEVLASMPELWQAIDGAIQRTKDPDPQFLQPLGVTIPDPQAFRAILWQYMERFPERTYPPVNDTSLSSHTRLSAILGFVVYRNLQARHAPILNQIIAYDGTQANVGETTVETYLDNGHPGNPLRGFNDVQTAICKNLDSYLVRVALTGYRDLFTKAGRLDDLHGTARLADLTRAFFKQALAENLGVPDLSDYLRLSENQFELIYLLPGSLTRAEIEQTIAAAYRQTTKRLIHDGPDAFLELMYRSFGMNSGVNFAAQAEELHNQLVHIGYGLGVTPLALPLAPQGNAVIDPRQWNFDIFATEFGKMLLTAYRESADRVTTPKALLTSTTAYLLEEQKRAIQDVCVACGVYPIYAEFHERAIQDENLRKVTHQFRGQPEALCVSCIARRLLSQGAVQVKPLEAMIHLDETGQWLVTRQAENGPDLPAALMHTRRCKRPDYVDMGAAFVRRRDNDQLDIFPTIGYAADANSNVLLLSLTPTPAIYYIYDYLAMAQPDFYPVTGETVGVHDQLNKTIREFHDRLRNRSLAAQAMQAMQAEPHVARVLEREKQIAHFYQAYYRSLEASAVRVIPLDVSLPTLRLLAPADQLVTVLETLQDALHQHLFSFPPGYHPNQRMLNQLPKLLLGTMILFKEKQPLYLVFETERYLLERLKEADTIEQSAASPLLLVKEAVAASTPYTWHGTRLGFTDMRRTLDDRGGWQAQVTLDNLAQVLELNQVDRRTVTARGATTSRMDMDRKTAEQLANALLFIRRDWAGSTAKEWTEKEIEMLTRPEYFEPVLFMKKATRA